MTKRFYIDDNKNDHPICFDNDELSNKEIVVLLNDLLRQTEVLMRISRWHGEFPDTDIYFDEEKTQQISYGTAFGSNGERDFMRNLAKKTVTRCEEVDILSI